MRKFKNQKIIFVPDKAQKAVEQFDQKCKRAGISFSARVIELIINDLKPNDLVVQELRDNIEKW